MNVLDVQKMIDDGIAEDAIIDKIVEWMRETADDYVLEKIYGEMDERQTT